MAPETEMRVADVAMFIWCAFLLFTGVWMVGTFRSMGLGSFPADDGVELNGVGEEKVIGGLRRW